MPPLLQNAAEPPVPLAEGAGTGSKPLLTRAAFVYASLMNHVVMSIGTFCFILSVRLHEERSNIVAIKQSFRLLVANLVVPFSETLGASLLPSDGDNVNPDDLVSTAPLVVGAFLCIVALLGHATLQSRKRWVLLVYGLMALPLLVLEAEQYAGIRKLIEAEDLTSLDSLTTSSPGHSESMRQVMFEAPYQAWITVYESQGCSVIKPQSPSGSLSLQCQSNFEGQLLEMFFTEVCQSPHRTDRQAQIQFKKRTDLCNKQGRELKILPPKQEPRDAIFCQCRTALYDWFSVALVMLTCIWCSEAVGVGIVCFFGVEKDLDKMDKCARKEVIVFGVFLLMLLMSKAMILEVLDESSLEV